APPRPRDPLPPSPRRPRRSAGRPECEGTPMSSGRFGPWILVLALPLGLAAGVGATALVLRRPTAAASAAAEPHAHAAYVCPMHPSISSDKPGERPISGMELGPVAAPSRVR